MKLSKDMLAALKGHMKGTQTGTPYGPELCDLGLLMVFEGEYVCTQAGIKACGPQEMKLSDLYVLCHLHCYNLIPNEECKAQVERLQALGLVDKQERITELGLDHIQKGLIV